MPVRASDKFAISKTSSSNRDESAIFSASGDASIGAFAQSRNHDPITDYSRIWLLSHLRDRVRLQPLIGSGHFLVVLVLRIVRAVIVRGEARPILALKLVGQAVGLHETLEAFELILLALGHL